VARIYLFTKDPVSIFDMNNIGALINILVSIKVATWLHSAVLGPYLIAAASNSECSFSEDLGTIW